MQINRSKLLDFFLLTYGCPEMDVYILVSLGLKIYTWFVSAFLLSCSLSLSHSIMRGISFPLFFPECPQGEGKEKSEPVASAF